MAERLNLVTDSLPLFWVIFGILLQCSMQRRNVEKTKISKNKRAKKEKPNITELPFGFLEKFAEYDLLERRHKLTSDGKIELKRLLDMYDSIQACRRRNGSELLPEIEILLNEFLLKKYSTSNDIPLPKDPFPYAWSDDEPLPCIPPEIEDPESSTISKGSDVEEPDVVCNSTSSVVDKMEERKNAVSDSPIRQDLASKDEQILDDFLKNIAE